MDRQCRQRPAASRLAHTVVELRRRLAITGRAAGDTFDMPLTQEQISEALGITPVHANRVIRQLRDDGIVDINRGAWRCSTRRSLRIWRSLTTVISTRIHPSKARAR
jgi:CRP-like cAMP-binding protein